MQRFHDSTPKAVQSLPRSHAGAWERGRDWQGPLRPRVGRQRRRPWALFSALLNALVVYLALPLGWVAAQEGSAPSRRSDAEQIKRSVVQSELARQRIPCFNQPGLGPEMVVITAGRFHMGSSETKAGRYKDEGPQHLVSVVKPFAMTRCEVTVGEFRRFVNEMRYETDAERENNEGCDGFDLELRAWRPSKERDWRSPGFEQSDDHPVVCVTWNDARVYAAWLSARTGQSYRLPTEAEWEYAARGQTVDLASDRNPLLPTQARFWGDQPTTACEFANVADRAFQREISVSDDVIHQCEDNWAFTAPVGSYFTNAFGLNDMLGNVWELTNDCWHENYNMAPFDGSAWELADGGDCNRRVDRGGSWFDKPEVVRSADRSSSLRNGAGSSLGFRLARDLFETPISPGLIQGNRSIEMYIPQAPNRPTPLIRSATTGTR